MRENDMMNGFCMLCGEQVFIPIGHEACHKMRKNRMQFDLCVKCAAKKYNPFGLNKKDYVIKFCKLKLPIMINVLLSIIK